MVWECYCNASPKPEFFLFSLFILSFISQLILVRLGWNFHRWFSIQKQVNWCTIWSFLFVVLHKPTLLPSTFKLLLTDSGQMLCDLNPNLLKKNKIKFTPYVISWIIAGRSDGVCVLVSTATFRRSHESSLLCSANPHKILSFELQDTAAFTEPMAICYGYEWRKWRTEGYFFVVNAGNFIAVVYVLLMPC